MGKPQDLEESSCFSSVGKSRKAILVLKRMSGVEGEGAAKQENVQGE